MDDIDNQIIKILARAGTSMQSVNGIEKLIVPPITLLDLQERLIILTVAPAYVKDEGHQHLNSTGPEMVSLTPFGLKHARDLR
jgi:hypothetical protein